MLLLLLSARGIFSEAARLIIYPIGIQNLKDAKTSAESRSGDFPESRWTVTEIGPKIDKDSFFKFPNAAYPIKLINFFTTVIYLIKCLYPVYN